ncbi:MAG: hypothetical protein VW644_09250 [Alphaproteobacteria bacterium]
MVQLHHAEVSRTCTVPQIAQVPLRIALGNNALAQVALTHIGAFEIGALESRAAQIGTEQVGIAQIGAPQIGAEERRRFEARSAQVGIVQADAGEIGTGQVDAGKIEAAAIGKAETGALPAFAAAQVHGMRPYDRVRIALAQTLRIENAAALAFAGRLGFACKAAQHECRSDRVVYP